MLRRGWWAGPLHVRVSTISVLGMPNTGKSTLFKRLTGHHAQIGNWPGLTVELLQADLTIHGRPLHLIDLPGIYDLRGYSEDEAVVRRFLERSAVDLVLVVLNASQLDRQLRLALQVQQLGLPAVVVLNMTDEASRFGVSLNAEALSSASRPAAAVAQLEEQPAAVDAGLDDAMAALVARSVTLPDTWRDRRTRRLDAVLLHPLLGLPLFFLAMGMVEDSGYLSRAAYLMDALMERLGFTLLSVGWSLLLA